MALLFAVGSAHFLVGALAATWPEAAPAVLRSSRNLGIAFFAGSVFFTTAAWLQWLEVLNAGPGDPRARAVRGWHWIGWRPRDLGFWACVVQLAGTVLFNFDTADAMLASLSWREEDLLVWSPNLLGSVCFLVASYLAFVEVSHAAASWAPRSVSWWIAVVNLAGSVAFQLSALTSFAGPGPGPAELSFASTFLTAAGALCFLGGAYLLVPELFDAS